MSPAATKAAAAKNKSKAPAKTSKKPAAKKGGAAKSKKAQVALTAKAVSTSDVSASKTSTSNAKEQLTPQATNLDAVADELLASASTLGGSNSIRYQYRKR